jgi:type IV secretory pathway TrbL component
MNRRLAIVLASVVVLVLAAAGAGIAYSTVSGDDDRALTGSTLQKASAAALRHTGGGTVVETETGDDGAAYGVEVRLSDGRVVEVSLDSNFKVVGREADDDGAGDEEENEDD